MVSPASLKTEWEEQIRKFTDLSARVVLGPKHERARAYREQSFFYLANYEQIVRDVREVNELLAPDEQGRPAGYANLDELRRRIRPLMLRRRKDEVEEQLPNRIDNNYFVEMSAAQRGPYEEYQARAARLLAQARKRPLTRESNGTRITVRR